MYGFICSLWISLACFSFVLWCTYHILPPFSENVEEPECECWSLFLTKQCWQAWRDVILLFIHMVLIIYVSCTLQCDAPWKFSINSILVLPTAKIPDFNFLVLTEVRSMKSFAIHKKSNCVFNLFGSKQQASHYKHVVQTKYCSNMKSFISYFTEVSKSSHNRISFKGTQRNVFLKTSYNKSVRSFHTFLFPTEINFFQDFFLQTRKNMTDQCTWIKKNWSWVEKLPETRWFTLGGWKCWLFLTCFKKMRLLGLKLKANMT